MTDSVTSAEQDWESRLGELLPLFGHRNWIVIADSAYPAQSRPGIETIIANTEQIDAVRRVLDAITKASHVRANVYVDKELGFIDDKDAPGIAAYREQLGKVLHGAHVSQILHDEIITKLDQSAQIFRILLIKTDMTIPYTTVFFELDCGYWNAEAEQRLRQAMQA